MMHLLELMRKNQFDEFVHQTPYLALRVTSMYSNNMCGLAVWFQHWTINLKSCSPVWVQIQSADNLVAWR